MAPVIASRSLEKGKVPLAMAPRKQLPAVIKNRSKTGFTVPVNRWLENNRNLDQWKSVESLKSQSCPWARRWAYTIMNYSTGGNLS